MQRRQRIPSRVATAPQSSQEANGFRSCCGATADESELRVPHANSKVIALLPLTKQHRFILSISTSAAGPSYRANEFIPKNKGFWNYWRAPKRGRDKAIPLGRDPFPIESHPCNFH